jgi:hypothetical protein
MDHSAFTYIGLVCAFLLFVRIGRDLWRERRARRSS